MRTKPRIVSWFCATIGQTQNTTPQELLDWCKCIASYGFDATSKALRSPAVEGK